MADSQSDNKHIPATAYLAMNDFDNTFKAIETAIDDHDVGTIDSLRIAERWDPIRFDDILALLDSKEIHTDKYLSNLDVQGSEGL